MPAKISVVLEGDRPPGFYLDVLRIAEEGGLYSVQLYEHLGYRPAWGTSFLLAPHTVRVRVGPVTVPSALTHPLYLAAQALYLNSVAGGRGVVGVSRGAFYERVGGAGFSRFEALRDTLEIVGRVFTHSAGGYHGNVYSMPEGVRLRFRYGGRPTFYVGSSGPRTIAMASTYPFVDGLVVDNLWNPSYTRFVLGKIEEGSRAGGRTGRPELIARPFCVLFEGEGDRGRARTLALKTLAEYLPALVDGSPMLEYAGITPEELGEFASHPEANRELADRVVGNFCAFGTPEEIVEQTHRMLKSGVQHVCFGIPHGLNPAASIKRLAEKVAPHFAEGRRH